jgi:hypothetical protein
VSYDPPVVQDLAAMPSSHASPRDLIGRIATLRCGAEMSHLWEEEPRAERMVSIS